MENRVSAILLAAGSSTRMSLPKPLLPIGNRPAVRLCLDNLLEAGLSDIITVLGPDGDEVERCISGYPVRVARNREHGSDMSGSVRCGLEEIDKLSTGCLISLCDHPLVSAETIKILLHAGLGSPENLIIPVFKNKRGHPTLFPRFLLRRLGKHLMLRDLIRITPDAEISLIEVADEGVILDMDTPEDYETICRKRNP